MIRSKPNIPERTISHDGSHAVFDHVGQLFEVLQHLVEENTASTPISSNHVTPFRNPHFTRVTSVLLTTKSDDKYCEKLAESKLENKRCTDT